MNQVLVAIFAPIIATIAGFLKIVGIVREGEQGVRLRFGRVRKNVQGLPKILDPGWFLLIPFVDSLEKCFVREQTLRLDKQKIMIENGIIFIVDAVVFFQISNVYRALFSIKNVDKAVEDLCMGLLREILSTYDHRRVVNTAEISKKLLEQAKQTESDWGVEFLRVKLKDCAPTAEMAHLVGIPIGVKLKAYAIEELKKANPNLYKELIEDSPNTMAVVLNTPLVATVEG